MDFWNSHIRDIIEAYNAGRQIDLERAYEGRFRIPDAPEADPFGGCLEGESGALDAGTESRLHSEP